MDRVARGASEAEPTTTAKGASPFDFLGGHPSIDFVNTVVSWGSEELDDLLHSYDDLLDWCTQANLVSSETLGSLREIQMSCPKDAERAFQRARALRERLFRTFVASSRGTPPAEKDLDYITRLARKAAAHSHLERRGESYAWVLDDAGGCDLDWPLWELAHASVDLLTSSSLQHVRQCADKTCGWLFLDQSRNHSRRWCDMATCGNRAKARRNYARKKAQQGTASP